MIFLQSLPSPDIWTRVLDGGLAVSIMSVVGYLGFKFLGKQLKEKEDTISNKDTIIQKLNNERVEDLKSYLDILNKVNNILDKVLIENNIAVHKFIEEVTAVKLIVDNRFEQIEKLIKSK